jgi:hypothetical protein
LALHVLEVMESVLRSAEDAAWADIASTVERPEPVPLRNLGSTG